MIAEGTQAPDFTLPADPEGEASLSDYVGHKVVLYFYPKDDTPGCTTEACSFRDVYDDILDAGAVVIGVSPDPVESHRKFRMKHSLPFLLLSDPDHRVADLYGAWGAKTVFGKKREGILRSTYLIDETGRVEKAFPNVNPAQHSQEVLAALRAL